MSPEEEQQLFTWFEYQREGGNEVSNQSIKDKASEICSLDDFKASNGWVYLFKKRRNIVMRAVTCKNQIDVEEKKS